MIAVRRELGVRTIFNFLGPLTNPAGARRQLVGVSDPRHLETIAGALALLGVERALVVAGEDGLDEISAAAPTRIVEVDGAARCAPTRSSPAELGIEPAPAPVRAAARRQEQRGRHARRPRRRARARTASSRSPTRAPRSTRRAPPARWPQGVERARAAVDDGRAAALLERWVEATRRVSILDEILASTREDVERRRARGARRRRPARRASRTPSATRSRRPGSRSSPSTSAARPRRARSARARASREIARAYERGGAARDLGADRGAPLRRLARGPARGARRVRAAAAAQGLHRRATTSSPRPTRRARTRCS